MTTLSVVILLLFFPIYNGLFLHNIGQSIGLYFQKFEFNAGFYYLLSWFGWQIKGYNFISFIGPLLADFSACSIIALSLFYIKKGTPDNSHQERLFKGLLFAISIYFLCATTVHPWYATLPILLCLFTPYRFPILWSALVILSYSHYNQNSNQENYWLIGIEYTSVFIYFIYEILSNGDFSRRPEP